jgi:endonuclease/exonuclease/phosphatase family metal-dependent hydrolase
MVRKKEQNSFEWRFTGFYGAPRAENRHHSWRFLRTLNSVQHSAWLCMGDFNETLYNSEHFSRTARPEWQMRNFREAVEECLFQDLGWSGTAYTWDNRQNGDSNVKARLDRAFANAEFLSHFEHTRVRHIVSTE